MNPQAPLRLTNGVTIPTVGLGVFRAASADTRAAVRAAIQAGYRHVDTAQAYGNEAAVGAAIRESGVPRDEVFVTTKLWNFDQGEERALHAFEQSRLRLGLEQVDLYLLHWPVPKLRTGSWRALERILQDGRVRAIGVSNFLPAHLDELEGAATVLPHVEQIEVGPQSPSRGHSAHLCPVPGDSAAEPPRPCRPAVRPCRGSVAPAGAPVTTRWSPSRGSAS